VQNGIIAFAFVAMDVALLGLDSKLIGGILLITGTSIGGAMLALPVATAGGGLLSTSLFLIVCWLIMTFGALFLLEVNLWCPKGSNIISMAEKTLGKPGKIVAWVSYLFLLYTLLSAYIDGGSDVLQGILTSAGISLSHTFAALLFVGTLGALVFKGMKSVDYANRALMFAKLFIFFLLVCFIAPKIHLYNFSHGHASLLVGSLMVLITSFGFASIIPSLRDYFDNDVARLKKAILIGSLIPLFCYLLWTATIMGVVPMLTLSALAHSQHATSGLSLALNQTTHASIIVNFFASFSAVCMLTAFLGVSLGLFDFLADGLKLEKKGAQGTLVLFATFLPPLLIVLFSPGAYLKALSLAGIFCVILLLLLPSLMLYRGRYHLAINNTGLIINAGKPLIISAVFIAIALLALAISQLYL
jgi:tyrosine-specific transport protein